MTSLKENYLLAMNHKPTHFTPCALTDNFTAGILFTAERGPVGGGVDGFGVRWVSPPSAAGGVLPAPGEFLLDEIGNWKKMKIPDLKSYDWEGMAATELANYNRDEKPLEIISTNCIFERLAALMGFENALLSMHTDPDDVYEFLGVLTDYKVEVAKYYAKYYKPDMFTWFDDIATERVLFMSPDTYRKLIKPHHTRLCREIRNLGVIPIQHTCGKADDIVQDMIDVGAAAWSAVQATNDIEGIIQKHGDEFTIVGGFNSNGPPGWEDAPEDIIRAEVRRCLGTYGKYGKAYIFTGSPLRSGTVTDAAISIEARRPVIEEVLAYRAEHGIS